MESVQEFCITSNRLDDKNFLRLCHHQISQHLQRFRIQIRRWLLWNRSWSQSLQITEYSSTLLKEFRCQFETFIIFKGLRRGYSTLWRRTFSMLICSVQHFHDQITWSAATLNKMQTFSYANEVNAENNQMHANVSPCSPLNRHFDLLT